MATYIQKGSTINYTNSGETKITAGTVVSLTNRIGIAAGDIAAGAVGALAVQGVFEAAKDTSNIALGALLYYDATANKFTTTSNGNIPAGWAAQAAAANAASVVVCISGEHPAPASVTVTPAAKVNAVSAADGAAAEGDAPTKAEFDAVVALTNANKAAVNAVIAALKAAGLMASV